jgi:hypothetical protein
VERCGHPSLWMTGDARKGGEHPKSGTQEGRTQEIARLSTIMHDWTRFGRARGKGCAHSTFLGGFFLIFSPNLTGAAGLGLGLGLGWEPIKVKCHPGHSRQWQEASGERARPSHFLPFLAICHKKIFFFTFIDLYPPLSTFIGMVWRRRRRGAAHGRTEASARHFGARPPARRRTECRPGRC